MKITKSLVEPLAYGGLILGAGGGGSLQAGMQTALNALDFGTPEIISLEDLADEEIVVTISGVGSPASKTSYIENDDYIRALQLLEEKTKCKTGALIPCEMGGSSSFVPFLSAALNNIPILDAPCNGRAHPLGTMGSLGLSEQNAQTTQAACGGDGKKDRHVELVVSGTVGQAASIVLSAAIQAGGLVVVARNPVPVSYIRSHAAIGAYAQSLQVGEAYLSGTTPLDKVRNVANVLQGTIIAEGVITDYRLETRNGLDVGSFTISGGNKSISMYFWNEYMALDIDGNRTFTFPDFMMTFDARTGMPFTSAEVEEGKPCYLVASKHENLILGAGMYECSAYKAVEMALGIEMVPYCLDLFA